MFFINFKYYEIMMKKLLLRVTTYALLLTASISFGQTIDLGTLSSFEAYTGSGTVLNSGTFPGYVGSHIQEPVIYGNPYRYYILRV